MSLSDLVVFVCVAAGGIFVIAWNLFFIFSKNAKLKRKSYRRAILFGYPILFLGMVLFMISVANAPLAILASAPIVALIGFINLKTVKFCDQCGATLYNSNWFGPMRYCSRCGAELTG